MSSQSDAHQILTDVDELTERLRTTYNDLGEPPCGNAHSLDRLNIEIAIGRLIDIRHSIVGYLDEWDGRTYSIMAERGWL